MKNTWIYGIIAIVIVAVAGFYFLSQPVPQILNDPFEGNENAKVVIVEFSDFQCPACGAAYTIMKEVRETYGDQIKFVYKDFPLTNIHPYAWKAAEAGQCALEQGMFWEYHDKMFENQQDLRVSKLKQYAADVGFDTAQFNSCLDSGKMYSSVAEDQKEGLKLVVEATPTFFVNGRKYQDVQPFEKFQQLIEAELRK